MMRIAAMMILLIASFLTPTLAQAGPIVAGDYVVLRDGPGNTGGGEFSMFVNGSVTSFITFCLQRTEYIAFGREFLVRSVTTYADDLGGNDYISSKTAWLYTQARNGTLAGYSHTQAAANLLQNAIWYFENEIKLASPSSNIFVRLANQAVDNGFSGIGNVRVVNLFLPNGQRAQDQLILAVPGPTSLIVAISGLTALALMRRRRTASRS
jgi:hypothetical protein